jgi:hypothetical protein
MFGIKNKDTKIVFIISSITIVMGIIGILLYLDLAPRVYKYEYTGKVMFNTEQEFATFKTYLMKDYVDYDPSAISELNTSYPIIVSFTINTGIHDYIPYFPYGTQINDGDWREAFAGLGLWIGVSLVFWIAALIVK